MHILRKTFFSKEQQKNFKFFLRRNIECTPSTKQEVVLPQKAQNRFTQKFIAEKSLPQMAQIYTEVMVL